MTERKTTVNYVNFGFTEEPFYLPQGTEVDMALMAYTKRLPLALTGPTGCGKTALTEYLNWRIRKEFLKGGQPFPYIEIPCHEDLSESHLVGQKIGEYWSPGPLYLARDGGLVVFDEFAEARPDIRVLTHGLAAQAPRLSIAKTGEVITYPDNFLFAVCFNPGYQILNRQLKASTAQRFVTLRMDYPRKEVETEIVKHHTGVNNDIAQRLVKIAREIRKQKTNQQIRLQEGASTRLLIHAGKMYRGFQERNENPYKSDTELFRAIVRDCVINPLTQDESTIKPLDDLLAQMF